MTDRPRPQRQLDVQRWLGRCMLRLQQYERLMKTLLAHHELAGPADTLEAQRAANLEKVSDKTLGTLQGLWEPRCAQRRAAKRKGAQGHEASHATISGADLEQLGRFALFCALSALRGLA